MYQLVVLVVCCCLLLTPSAFGSGVSGALVSRNADAPWLRWPQKTPGRGVGGDWEGEGVAVVALDRVTHHFHLDNFFSPSRRMTKYLNAASPAAQACRELGAAVAWRRLAWRGVARDGVA